ncbi:hypothetical protein DRO60_02000 [Candidatus Bathyarchaeota archaeon]|nr:MAG: hypothetical protein DRO60_02000 [Candidatus Bathyarchaeota archaeon]
MPLTPLHYPLAYAMKKAGRKAGLELDMAGLAIGSFTPDLECPFFALGVWLGILPASEPCAQAHRLVLHSLFGAMTIGPLITMLLVSLLRWLLRARIEALGLKRPSLLNLYASSALGNLSHVLIDAVHHSYNPLLFPLTAENVMALVPLGDLFLGTVIAYALVLPSSIAILIYEARRGRWLFTRLLFDV